MKEKNKMLKWVLLLPTCMGMFELQASIPIVQNNTETKTTTKDHYFGTITKLCFTDSVQEINKAIDDKADQKIKITKGTLVIIDIDDTILWQASVAVTSKNDSIYDAIEDRLMKQFPQYGRNYDYYLNVYYDTVDERLTEAEWPEFVANIRSRQGKALAITTLQNAPINGNMLADIRAEKLKKLGIDLSGFFNSESTWLGRKDTSPYYSKQGVLTSLTGLEKGKDVPQTKPNALNLFLKHENNRFPKGNTSQSSKVTNIIMIDDKEENLYAMGNYCLGVGIPYTGIRYDWKKYNKKYDYKPSKIRTYIQLKGLIEHERYLTDEEAEQKLKANAAQYKEEYHLLMGI